MSSVCLQTSRAFQSQERLGQNGSLSHENHHRLTKLPLKSVVSANIIDSESGSRTRVNDGQDVLDAFSNCRRL